MELEKINKIWPRMGAILAAIIIISVSIQWKQNTPSKQLVLLFWLNLAILMLHEFEEYVFPGGFKHFANTKSILSLPHPQENAPITETLIIVINLGVWVIFIIAALLGETIPWLGVGMIFFNLINIVGHLLIFQKNAKGYNPGVITSILMIPFVIYAIFFVVKENLLNPGEMTVAILIGIISGAALPITGTILRKKYSKKQEKQ